MCPAPPRGLHTFVSSIGPGGGTRGSRMVRVAVARADVLIVVRPRLRRPEIRRKSNEMFWGLRVWLETFGFKSCRVRYLAGLLWFFCRCCSYSSRVLGRTTSSECGWKPTKIIAPKITLPQPQWKYTFVSNEVWGSENISLQSTHYGKLPCSLPLAVSFPSPSCPWPASPSLAPSPSPSPVPSPSPAPESFCTRVSLVPSSAGRFPAKKGPEHQNNNLQNRVSQQHFFRFSVSKRALNNYDGRHLRRRRRGCINSGNTVRDWGISTERWYWATLF